MALQFDADDYRQRLNLALNPSSVGVNVRRGGVPQIENRRANLVQPAPPPMPESPQEPQGGNLAAAGGAAAGSGAIPGMGGQQTPGAGDPTGAGAGVLIDEAGAMGRTPERTPSIQFPKEQNGKIQTRPPDLDFDSIDEKKLATAKTMGDVFDAATPETQNKYMDWWEKSYGDINAKYDAMQKELGDPPESDPRKMSKKQKFVGLLSYAARMMSTMRRHPDADPMAASNDAYEFGRQTATGDRMTPEERNLARANIERGRASELKTIGTKGEAMDKQSEINLRAAQADNMGGGERFTDENGLVWTIPKKGGQAVPVKGPDGKQLRGAQNLGSEGGNDQLELEKFRYDEYMRTHGVDRYGKPLTGERLRKVERAARNHARYGTMPKDETVTDAELRAQARDRANTMLRSSPDTFRGMDAAEVSEELSKIEEQEYERLKKAQNLGLEGPAAGGRGPRAPAPAKSEEFVRKNPDALYDFVQDYGYVPEGMADKVTPDIRELLGE